MAGTTVTANLGGWGGSGDDSAVEQLVKLLNELVDDLETFRAAMATANGAAISIGNLTARRIQQIDEILQSITPSTPDTTPASIAKTAGDSQTATVGTEVTIPFKVTVKNAAATVLAGIVVGWETTDGGILAGTQSITDASGEATMPFTLGASAGGRIITATVQGYPAISTTFTATGTADVAALIEAVSVTDQSAIASGVVAAPPSVQVKDRYGNAVESETVTFAVTAGGGSRVPATVDTDATGIATLTSWTMGASAGLNTLTATVGVIAGSPVTFNANAVAAAPTQIAIQSGGDQTGVVAGDDATAVVARVKDVSNNAVEGVTVSAVVTTGNGTLDTATAVTNASGDASFVYTTHTTVETATLTFSFVNAAGSTVSVTTTIASAAGTATKLVIATQPASNGDSGVALPGQPIIHVTDANGNVATGATNSIAAAIGTGNAVITAGTPKAAVAGVATFTALTLTDSDSGANTIVFSTAGLTSATSTGVTLAPPVPVALQFVTQPNSVIEDVGNLSCAVWILDENNIVVPSATNAITVALTTPGGATLSGTLTVNAVTGTANFSGLAVDTVGTYTLTATSTGLTSAVSNSFSVTAASGAHPNEPAGFTQIHDTDFSGFTTSSPAVNGAAVQGVTRYATGNTGRAILDTVAPYSGATVFRVTFNNGSAQGTGPEHLKPGTGTNTIGTSNNFTELYQAFYIRVDSDYRTPAGSGVQKLFHVWGLTDGSPSGAGNSIVVPAITGTATDSTSANLRIGIRYQNMSTVNGGQISFNGAVVGINRNQWYLVEVYCKMNTGSSADGVCTMYIDGVQRTNLTNLTYKNGGAKEWTNVQLNPTYGGTGTVTGPQYLYYALWYTSGKT